MCVRKNVFNETDFAKYREAYAQPGMIKAALNYYRAAFRSVAAPVVLPKIKAPVLMLWGEQDKALGKELTYNTNRFCEGSFEIQYDPTSGHFIQHENPQWVNQNLLKFFESRMDA